MRAAEAGEFRRGWLVLIGCFIGMGVSTVSLMGYSAGVFIQPLSGEFGWARAELGAAALIGNVIVMVAAPFAGRFVDRHGLRRTAPLSMLLYAGCVVLLSRDCGHRCDPANSSVRKEDAPDTTSMKNVPRALTSRPSAGNV